MKLNPLRRIPSRLRLWMRNTLLVVLALWLGPVLLWRFIDPPLTMLMAKRLIAGWTGNGPTRFLHDAVSIEDVSPNMVIAILAAEDQLFLEHHGFDWDAIFEAFKHNQNHKRVRGASTISQQTAKNVFLWERRSWIRKALEVPYTFAIELLWGKRRILEAYLNVVEFGPGVYGVEAAAQHYWHIPASRLNTSQASLLAATLPSPRRNNPASRTGFLIRHSGHVLAQLPYMDRGGILEELGLSQGRVAEAPVVRRKLEKPPVVPSHPDSPVPPSALPSDTKAVGAPAEAAPSASGTSVPEMAPPATP